MLMTVVFRLDGRGYALGISSIVRVIRAMAIQPLPKAPEIIIGVINVQGNIIPVVDIRKRFGLTEKPLSADDVMIIARTKFRTLAFCADSVDGYTPIDTSNLVDKDKIWNGLEYITGVASTPAGITLIDDLSGFLKIDEEEALGKLIRTSSDGIQSPQQTKE